MPKNLFRKNNQLSETSSGASVSTAPPEPELLRLRREVEAASAAYADAQRAGAEARQALPGASAAFDAAAVAFSAGRITENDLADARSRFGLASARARGADVREQDALAALRTLQAQLPPLEAVAQQRQRAARIDNLASDFRKALRDARKHLALGAVHTRAMEAAVNQIAAMDRPAAARLAKEATGLPVTVGSYDPAQVGGIRWAN